MNVMKKFIKPGSKTHAAELRKGPRVKVEQGAASWAQTEGSLVPKGRHEFGKAALEMLVCQVKQTGLCRKGSGEH